MTPEERADIIHLAEKILERQPSKSYVGDGISIAQGFMRLLSEYNTLAAENKQLHENLTATQARCTKLFNENRKLRGIEVEES